jgi:hypothetical protein
MPEAPGWTCTHMRDAATGPCIACLPMSGLCTRCKRALDDHRNAVACDQVPP